MKITEKQKQAFMKARYPKMRYFRNSDSWTSGDGQGMTDTEVKAEAQAEIELAHLGIAKMPVWAQ